LAAVKRATVQVTRQPLLELEHDLLCQALYILSRFGGVNVDGVWIAGCWIY
jgi:hypothetical protein